jgi:PDZ domain-containing protein
VGAVVETDGTGMKQRGFTVLVGAIVVLLLSALVAQAPVPYVSLEPGPTFDTLGVDDQDKQIIVIDGTPTSDSAGQLRFLTVGVVPRLTLLEAVEGWLNGDDAVVPRELIYPPDQSQEQVEQQNAEDFANSLSSAQVAALRHLGYPPVIAIKEVSSDSPNAPLLKAGDVFRSVDDKPIVTEQDLLDAIRGKPAGSTLTLAITRDGSPMTVQVTTVAGDDGVPRVGFVPEEHSSAPFTITIPIEGIGGPSAGLMMALGIIDKLEPADLTGGRIIAGTGTIDDSGAVGPIGGVPQKILGAKAAGATVFLTPKDNCAEAVANSRPGLLLVQVDSLDTALAALDTLRKGNTPTLCPGAPTS